MVDDSPQSTKVGSWTPLAYSPFGRMWAASLISNIGSFMQNIGAAWFLTAAGLSASWLGALQAATTTPVFLCGLFAGVLADVQSRRNIILIAQAWLAASTFYLAYLAYSQQLTPYNLLILSFAMGVGTAFHMPAWTATLPRLVPSDHLPAAVTLAGVSMNLARAVGPALGGFIIGVSSIAATFLLNAFSFVLVFLVVMTWREAPRSQSIFEREHYISATRMAISYAWRSPAIRSVLLRSFTTLFCSSALWVLLPLRAKNGLGLSAMGLGLLLGFLGSGSLLGVLVLTAARRKEISLDRILTAGALAFAFAALVVALSNSVSLICLALLIGGIGWIAVMATYNLCAQIAVAAWVQARAVALFLMTTQGAVALGGIFWGFFASRFGVENILVASAVTLFMQTALSYVYPLAWLQHQDLRPSEDFAATPHETPFELEDGPIEIRIIYSVAPENHVAFLTSLYELRTIRLRDGNYDWRVTHSPDTPNDFIESFWISSWADHLRQHRRMTKDDEAVYYQVRSFNAGQSKPIVTHHMCLPPPTKH